MDGRKGQSESRCSQREKAKPEERMWSCSINCRVAMVTVVRSKLGRKQSTCVSKVIFVIGLSYGNVHTFYRARYGTNDN